MITRLRQTSQGEALYQSILADQQDGEQEEDGVGDDDLY
jgi:hypothetical protein